MQNVSLAAMMNLTNMPLADMTIDDLLALKQIRKLTKAEAGKLGGLTTLYRHGVEHFQLAGEKGFRVFCEKNNLCAEQALFKLAKMGRIKIDWARFQKSVPAGKDGVTRICMCTSGAFAGKTCWECGGYIL